MKHPFESELERLARTLTDQFGVQVVCQGEQAFTDGTKIVIPSLPEPMEQALERMMLGYLDHEMAHVAFSDFKAAEEFEQKHPGCLGLLNVIEDALIERKAMDRWPGVRRNLDMLFKQIRGRVAQLITQREPFDRFCTAVYLRLCHHKDMMGLESELAGFDDLIARFPLIHDTREAATLAEAILERWLKSQTQQQTAQQPQVPEEGNDSQPQANRSAGSNTSTGNGQGAESHSNPQTPPANGDGDESSQANGARRDPNQTSSAGDQKMPTSDTECSGQKGQQRQKSGSGGLPGHDATPEPVTARDNEDVAKESGGSCIAGIGGGGLSGNTLISDAVAEAIAEQVAGFDTSRQYRPFTRQHDRIEVVSGAKPAEVEALLETGKDTVRRLRRGLTNALRAAEKRWWRDDQIRGELSPRTLHRLCMDRPRLDIFRTRSVVQGKSTAVSILLDASGSMSRRKMEVARSAMRALLEALGDLKIATEALIFTTGNLVDMNLAMQQTGLDAGELRNRYGRMSNLEIGLVKQFGEPVKAALSRLPSVQGSGLTPLGEAMQITAARLIHRRETRRILLVLTDGKAGCEGGSDPATAHAQDMATRITKAGIELIGVGILDENIREVVAEAIVIQTLEELPAQLCKLLGRTLTKGLKHVG